MFRLQAVIMDTTKQFSNPFLTEKREELWAKRKLYTTSVDKKQLLKQWAEASKVKKSKTQ